MSENRLLPVSPWKNDFPMLEQTAYGRPLVYLDNAATTQMPEPAVRRLSRHYETEHANIHRGAHYFSSLSTEQVEEVRCAVRDFLHAEKEEEIIFTAGATDSAALVANGIREQIGPGDAVMATELEHHSNYVPWQEICRQTGARFLTVPVDADGDLDMEKAENLLKTNHVFLFAVTQVSNSVGTAVDVKSMAGLAHKYGAQLFVDGAQGVRHGEADMQELDCDYYCFSAHKMMGPTGVGILYGKEECLEKLLPLRLGGGMVDRVDAAGTTYAELPHRLEGGTPPIAEIIAFGASLEYLQSQGMDRIAAQEDALISYLESRLREREDIHILGNPAKREGLVSFYSCEVHSFDIAGMLDRQGVAVRSGSLCAQPALRSFGLETVVRVSPAFYNGKEDIDRFCSALDTAMRFFGSFSR